MVEWGVKLYICIYQGWSAQNEHGDEPTSRRLTDGYGRLESKVRARKTNKSDRSYRSVVSGE